MEDMKEEYPEEVGQGLTLLKRDDFYEAHEAFEAAWRRTKDSSREFFRALLLISGGFFRLGQSRPEAAKKFFNHALKWLEPFPNPHLGVNTSRLKDDIRTIIQEIEAGNDDLEKIKVILHLLNG